MLEYLGSIGKLSLFAIGDYSVIIDTELNIVTEMGALSNIQKSGWTFNSETPETAYELASVTLDSTLNPVVASTSRMYTIPDGVKSEAIKALKWHKEHHRGGTPVGLNTARTLAKGGQIGLAKVRHIAKYFPRHEVDKKGKGWDLGEDNFPSNGRIAWALWGGDAAWRWASAIVEREKRAMTSTGYTDPEYEDHLDSYYEDDYESDINAFKEAHNLDSSYGPEFLVRVRLDGSGIDRLYKIEIDGHVYVWDDCSWDDLGYIDGDIYTYDSGLDDPYDKTEKTHVLVDPDSAIVISALMQESPFKMIQIDDINPDESQMFSDSIEDFDMGMIDRIIQASGFEKIDDSTEEKSYKIVAPITPINTKGILAQPVVEKDGPVALLSSGPSPMTKYELDQMLTDWSNAVTKFRGKVALTSDGASAEDMTPKTSDVEPKYIAIVSPDDPQAVMDVVAIVPKTATTNQPLTYKRKDQKWVLDEQILRDLQSATPPPVVKLDTPELVKDILKQVDESTQPPKEQNPAPAAPAGPMPAPMPAPTQAPMGAPQAAMSSTYQHLINFWGDHYSTMVAGGGLDRNRGNAEKLRRYWTRGEGALKIKWGLPGDWKRCVRHLAKYLGPRAKGYCQLRHKEALGFYTATHAKRDRNRGR